MMVPFVDFLNHLPVDTHVSVFNLQNCIDKNTDFRMLLNKQQMDKLDP